MEVTKVGGAAWWAAAAMTAVNALTSAGFSIAGLVSVPPGNEAARIASMYAAARSIPLALVILGLISARASRPLTALAIVMAVVQALDAGVGLAQHDAAKTIGPAVFATLTLAAVRTLLRTSSEQEERRMP